MHNVEFESDLSDFNVVFGWIKFVFERLCIFTLHLLHAKLNYLTYV